MECESEGISSAERFVREGRERNNKGKILISFSIFFLVDLFLPFIVAMYCLGFFFFFSYLKYHDFRVRTQKKKKKKIQIIIDRGNLGCLQSLHNNLLISH